MRIIAIIIPLMWGTVIFGHGKEKHEPKIIDDHKVDNTSQMVIPDEGERLKSVNDKVNNTKTNVVAETVEENLEPPEKAEITVQLEAKRSMGKWLGLDEFPTLHPMVVHLPVVLLPFAFLLLVIEFLAGLKAHNSRQSSRHSVGLPVPLWLVTGYTRTLNPLAETLWRYLRPMTCLHTSPLALPWGHPCVCCLGTSGGKVPTGDGGPDLHSSYFFSPPYQLQQQVILVRL